MLRPDFTTEEIVGMLRRAAGQPCPPSCKCPRHQTRANVRLVAVADDSGVTFTDCDGSMTCTCDRCHEQRVLLIRTPHSRDKRQPWQPLPAAQAA